MGTLFRVTQKHRKEDPMAVFMDALMTDKSQSKKDEAHLEHNSGLEHNSA